MTVILFGPEVTLPEDSLSNPPLHPTGTPQERVKRFLKFCVVPALVFTWLIVSFYAYFGFLKGQTKVGLTDGAGHPLGDCFINFWTAARLALNGSVDTIYNWEVFHLFEQNAVGATIDYYHYSYPPVMPLLTLPLGWLSYPYAFAAWLAITWFLFYLSLRALKPPISPLFISLAVPAFLTNAAAGQNGTLTAALLGGGLVLLPKRPAIAGILFGLLCFKPQLAFLIPVALICGKEKRAFIAAALTGTALVGLSVFFFGPDLWKHYLQTTQMLRHYVLEDNIPHSWQQFVSVFVAAREIGLSIVSAYAVQGTFACLALYAVIASWARPVSHDIRCAALVLGTFMATPYVMGYDLVITAFVSVWLSRSYRHHHIPTLLMLATPVLATGIGTFYNIGVGPLLLLPAFILVLSSCRLDPIEQRAKLLGSRLA